MFLEVKNAQKYYGVSGNRTKALDGVDFSLDEGEICVILGPSGSGKSTLLNVIGGLEPLDGGEILVGGASLSNCDEEELENYRRETLGFVFQFYNLLPDLSVRENIRVCEYLSKNPLDIDELICALGLSAHEYKMPAQLSGGQQQRCAIGRALIKNPKLLLCDEPTGALDYSTSKEILALMEDINKKYNTSILIVTHNQALSKMADSVVEMKDGKISRFYKNSERVAAAEIEW